MDQSCEPKTKEMSRRRWYQNYLPFIARSPEMQVEWLVTECRRRNLSHGELTPYVRLLFSEENVENEEELRVVLAGLDPEMQEEFLQVADIYDVPRIIRLIAELNENLVVLALTKKMPPYEMKPQKVMDRILNAINDRSESLLRRVATMIIDNGAAPNHFSENYERFRAILADKEFIRSQWPNTK
ncbi:MAG: hypothetical protein KKD73_02435 [Proteobacteria bacterium]|nr:hypothetical protein [Pseudomonadota bacterium]MBU1640325.1 hypothetical protein [Pseudomonadota bacterium]